MSTLCHQLYRRNDRGNGVPFWVVKKRAASDGQEVGQARTIRDKQFNPWAGKKRSDDQFNPWAGRKRDDKM